MLLDVEPRGSIEEKENILIFPFHFGFVCGYCKLDLYTLDRQTSLLVRKKPLYTFWWEKHKKYEPKPEPKVPLASYDRQRQNHTCGLSYAIILIG